MQTQSLRSAGAVLLTAALGWFLLEAVCAAHFPGYSYLSHYISDLGVPEPGVFQGRALQSTMAWLANLMFISQGAAFLVAAVLIARAAPAGVARWMFLLAAGGYAAGYFLIGSYHGSQQAYADGSFALHVLGGSLAVVCGNLVLIVAGLCGHRLGASRTYRIFSLGISALGIASLTVLVLSSGSATGTLLPSGPADGLWERGGCYAIIVWEGVTGLLLLAARGRARLAGQFVN